MNTEATAIIKLTTQQGTNLMSSFLRGIIKPFPQEDRRAQSLTASAAREPT